MSPVRVFHCDDSSSFRLLVREMLGPEEGFEVVGGASTVAEAEETLPAAEADVVLLDLLDDHEEDPLVERLRAVAPRPRFVVYSGMPERRGGAADAHVHKSERFEELRRVLAEVAGRA